LYADPPIVQSQIIRADVAASLLDVHVSVCPRKAKRMIPGSSVKELVPESPNEKEDGISEITFGQLFKPGAAQYRHVETEALKNGTPFKSAIQ